MAVRAGIFLAAGLVCIYCPKDVYKFQVWVFELINSKRVVEQNLRYLYYFGIIFNIIAIILFLVSVKY